jgi:hypothetical protein
LAALPKEVERQLARWQFGFWKLKFGVFRFYVCDLLTKWGW